MSGLFKIIEFFWSLICYAGSATETSIDSTTISSEFNQYDNIYFLELYKTKLIKEIS